MKQNLFSFLMFFAILLSACGPAVTPLAETLPVVGNTEEPLPVATQTEQPDANASSWKAVRDARYGFGLAVPCWWLVSPIPAEGFGNMMTIMNFDEAYRSANSTKGFWE